LTNAVAGIEAKFRIIARDASKNQLNKGGAHFKAVFKDPNGDIDVAIVDNKDGTYDCTYLPSKASPVTELMVTLSTKGYGDGDIEGSSFCVKVTPGAPSAEHTFCRGDGIHGGKAGDLAPVTLQSMDSCGNRVTTGGAPVAGFLTYQGEGGGTPVPVAVTDNNNGTYGLDYLPEKAGTYLLDVKIGDKSVKDAPFTITIEAGAFDPLNFDWEGLELDAEGRRVLVAGNTDAFKVGAKDAYGNPLKNGGLSVAGSISGPSDVPVSVSDNSDGSYALSYTPFKAGNYELLVDVDGTPIGGGKNPNPCKLLVIAANADGAHSIASGPGLVEASVGGENKFSVQARDAFDNNVTMGGADVAGVLATDDGTEIPILVEDNGDGTYGCSYPNVKKAGTYKITPTLNGTPVSKAPFTVVVKPGNFSLENTEVEFPAENMSSLNGPKIKVKDEQLNLRAGGGDRVAGEILPLDRLEFSATDKGNGSFDVRYPPNLRGQFEMQILVNGVDTGVTHAIEVKENPLTPAIEQKLAQASGFLAPENVALLRHLLLNASEEERGLVLTEILAL